jgi:hypothetical protein
MPLWDAVKAARFSSVAVFGMSKNAGKTVALRHLADAAGMEGVPLGLTSIGRDGEAWDVLIHRPKPSIHLAEGSLLATARGCLEAGTARLETLEVFAATTPLGPVHITRVGRAGTVEAAGPSRVDKLSGVVGRLLELGAELVLVDGAVDRSGLASPFVTRGCVLASGAVLSRDRAEVVRLTKERVRRITLPTAPAEDRARWKAGLLVVLAAGREESFSPVEAFRESSEIRAAVQGAEAVVLAGGALTGSLLRGLMGERVRVVVRDATCVFADEGLLRRFREAGGGVEVVRPLKLMAVTVNPFSPGGWSFDAFDFFRDVRDALPGVPVFDVAAGLGPA